MGLSSVEAEFYLLAVKRVGGVQAELKRYLQLSRFRKNGMS